MFPFALTLGKESYLYIYGRPLLPIPFSSSLLPPSLHARQIESIHVPFPARHYTAEKEHFNNRHGLVKQNDDRVFILGNKHIDEKNEDLAPHFFHSYNCILSSYLII